jgi:hypothetical protein
MLHYYHLMKNIPLLLQQHLRRRVRLPIFILHVQEAIATALLVPKRLESKIAG